MTLPIQRIPNTVPPQFLYYQTINLPQGGTQRVEYRGAVASPMEAALCELLQITEKLVAENARLRK